MNFTIRYKTIYDMLLLIKEINNGNEVKGKLESLLNQEDYEFEFNRYKNRVLREEFLDYLISMGKLKEEDINNEDIKIHHKYYLDLINNNEFYLRKLRELDRLSSKIIRDKIWDGVVGLPKELEIPDVNIIFTLGIGETFGYVNENSMHFDFLQFAKDYTLDEIYSLITKQFYNIGISMIHEEIEGYSLSLESLFYLYFSKEGLALKYCNNAEGVISKKINEGTKNIGIDKYSWDFLNNDFKNTMFNFKNTITNIRNNKIRNREELINIIIEYWMSPYTHFPDEKGIPSLKNYRIQSFGNEIWGIIHDCFGKKEVYETMKNIEKFPDIFNRALEKLGFEEYKI